MIVRFNSLDRAEKPVLTLCNPGSTYTNGKLSKVIGILNNHEAEECVFNFNATSELNFRVNAVSIDDDDTANEYLKTIYDAVKNKRLIFMNDIGYFVINSVNEQHEDGRDFKDVSAKSIDAELEQRNIPYIEDGTYRFSTSGNDVGIFDTIMSHIPLWTIGEIDSEVAGKYRTFEDVDTSLNCLGFMIEKLQEAYECIILFDTINRTVNVYDQNNYVQKTSVHLTKEDVINSLKITEQSDDLYTAITVSGENEDVLISAVNPLGTNTIYNYTYYLDWMSPNLKTKVIAWQNAIKAYQDDYSEHNYVYYSLRDTVRNLQADIEAQTAQMTIYNKCLEGVKSDDSKNIVKTANTELAKYSGSTQINMNQEISQIIAQLNSLIAYCQLVISSCETEIAGFDQEIEYRLGEITAIQNALNMSTYFTEPELAELSYFTFEGTYRDEYVIITDIMSYSEKFSQMELLYSRAESQLEKVSTPTQEFDISVENILFAKEFQFASEQLQTGCLINVELKQDDVAELFLSCINVNYEDHSLSMTFGNRFNKFDPKSLFNKALGSISKSANTLNYVKDLLYPIKEGALNIMAQQIQNSRDLTMASALAATSQEVDIDASGITCRRRIIDDDGEYDGFEPEQMKIISNNIVFTDDAWETSKLAIGRILYEDGATTRSRYGVNAEVLIGDIIIGNELHIKDNQGQDIMTVIDGRISTEVTEVKSAAASGTYEYYDPNNSSWSEKNNVDFFGYGISQDRKETDTGVKAADNENKYFLDKHVGNLYKAEYVPATEQIEWVFQKTLSPKFDNYSTTAYTDGKASTAESNAKTYADGKATDAYNNALSYVSTYYITSADASTAINQTKNEIEMTAAKAVSKYEVPAGITINFAGYGNPTTQGAVATAANQYYLDQETGNLYKSNSSKQWGSTPTQTLTLITSNLNSKIDQTAESITQTVSATYSTKTETATAKSEAISTAFADATTKANNAKSEAISTASADATSKANAAENNAKDYTDTQIVETTSQMNTKIDQTAEKISLEATARIQATVGYTSKNLLEITVDSKTSSGVTFTVDKTAGTITVTGEEATAATSLFVPISSDLSGDYYFSGCPVGGSNSTYDLYAYDKTAGARIKKWDGTTDSSYDYGGTSQEIKLIQGHENGLYVRIRKGLKNFNLVFRPMVRDSSFTDDATFEPYRSVQTQITETNSKVVQTAYGITQTVAAANAVEYIIPSGTTVHYHGYGFAVVDGQIDYTVTDTGISAVGNSGKRFLDQSDGMLYVSDGTTWNNSSKQQLSERFSEYSTSAQTTSEINQTADSISLEAKARLESTVGYTVKNQFEITGTTSTVSGVTFTVDKSAGTVVATNAASATTTSTFTLGAIRLKAGKTYILSGCPSGGGSSSYRLYADYLSLTKYYDEGNGVRITTSTNDVNMAIKCDVYTANTTSTITFSPMVRDASIADDTFEPYTQSDVNSKINVTTNGIMLSSAQMAYGKRTKNLIPFVLQENVKSSSSGSTTCKRDGDGYKLTNSPTANVVFALYTTNASNTFNNAKLPDVKTLPTGKYIISGTGFDNDIQYRIQYSTDGSTATKILYFGEDGDTSEKTFEITDAMTYVRHYVWVRSGKNLGSGVTIKPMIRDANIVDNTYTAGVDSGKYMCSAINLTPEQLKLDAGKLIIESGNFRLDDNGTMTSLSGVLQTSGYTPATENTKTSGGKIDLAAISGSSYLLDTANFKISGDGDVQILGGSIDIQRDTETSKDSYMLLRSKFVATDNNAYSYRMNISPYQITHQFTQYSGNTSTISVRDVIYIGNNGNITLLNDEGLATKPRVVIGTSGISASETVGTNKPHSGMSAQGFISYDTASDNSPYTYISGSTINTKSLYTNSLSRASGNIAVGTSLAFLNEQGIVLGNNEIAFRMFNSEVAVGISARVLRFYGTNVLLQNGTAVTSDERKKQSIESLDNRYLNVVKSIEPKRFKYIDIEKDRYHSGYIAQDVKAAMDKVGIAIDEMSAFVDAKGDGSELALRYEEFIPMLHKWLQELDSRISALEGKENNNG